MIKVLGWAIACVVLILMLAGAFKAASDDDDRNGRG